MKYVNKIFLLILITILFSCSTKIIKLKDLINSSDINISDKQIERFKEYFKGNYYSYEFKRKEINTSPIMFAITEDGTESLIIMCDNMLSNLSCDANVKIVQLTKYFEKKLNKKLKIISIDKNIYSNNNTIYIKNEKLLDQAIKKYFKNFVSEKNTYLDILLADKFDNCNSDC